MFAKIQFKNSCAGRILCRGTSLRSSFTSTVNSGPRDSRSSSSAPLALIFKLNLLDSFKNSCAGRILCRGTSLVPAFAAATVLLTSVNTASALPWDRDMYRQQSYQANEMNRAPAAGTVPLGSKPWTMTTEEAEKTLKNPVPVTRDSVWRGRRLWQSNCVACHGNAAAGDGPVGPLMGVPNIVSDVYREKTDGRTYGVLMNGGSNMPRYGFKFSEAERWDVINYVRFLQGKEVEGLERPTK